MYLYDTDILIDYIRSKSVTGFVRRFEQELVKKNAAISVVTFSEFRLGALKTGKLAETETFLASFPVLPMDTVAGEHYSEIRHYLESQGLKIGANDTWIAAHARASGCVLITGNHREFQRVPELTVCRKTDFK